MQNRPPTDPPTAVRVTVVRSGGFAGLRREWTARPEPVDAPRWVALIHDCPWQDADTCRPAEPDRFVWHIEARLDDSARAVALPESHLQGPWRDLVDQVQAFERERTGDA
ncbi:hypothetical protein GCM10022240_20160 [Microbacterium kribbense]|uniref:Uncharacterized protein n=1 Tax=Microbacterium kribbense TaxID=433645 RepID=A0ABP7GK65_9MICO